MKSKWIEIKSAKCSNCGRDVNFETGMGRMWSREGKNKTKFFIDNTIYTYFSCRACGAISAKVNGKPYAKPSDMFKEIKFEGKAIKRT